MTDLWFIADMGGRNLLDRAGLFHPIASISPEELLDDDGDLYAFHTRAQAQAFANGVTAGGRIAGCLLLVFPWSPPGDVHAS